MKLRKAVTKTDKKLEEPSLPVRVKSWWLHAASSHPSGWQFWGADVPRRFCLFLEGSAFRILLEYSGDLNNAPFYGHCLVCCLTLSASHSCLLESCRLPKQTKQNKTTKRNKTKHLHHKILSQALLLGEPKPRQYAIQT